MPIAWITAPNGTAVRLKAHLDIDGVSPDELDALVAHAAQWSPSPWPGPDPALVASARIAPSLRTVADIVREDLRPRLAAIDPRAYPDDVLRALGAASAYAHHIEGSSVGLLAAIDAIAQAGEACLSFALRMWCASLHSDVNTPPSNTEIQHLTLRYQPIHQQSNEMGALWLLFFPRNAACINSLKH